MTLRWAPRAVADLERIVRRVDADQPARAPEIAREIVERTEGLLRFPNLGRVGRKPGTRELVIVGTPFVVIYRLRGEAVHALRVVHGAQDWLRPSIASDPWTF